MKLKTMVCVTGICAVALIYPQNSYAGDVFKSSDFLKWRRNSQEFYIRTSVGMANIVVAQNDEKQAQCVDNWYYSNENAKNKFILETMQKYSEYHPRGVILGVLQKQCGEFKYR